MKNKTQNQVNLIKKKSVEDNNFGTEGILFHYKKSSGRKCFSNGKSITHILLSTATSIILCFYFFPFVRSFWWLRPAWWVFPFKKGYGGEWILLLLHTTPFGPIYKLHATINIVGKPHTYWESHCNWWNLLGNRWCFYQTL